MSGGNRSRRADGDRGGLPSRWLLGGLALTWLLALVAGAPVLAQEGTERFSTDETRRLSAELTDAESRAVELERAVDASYEGDLGGSGEERRRLREEQQAAEDRSSALREDLAQARLEAIRDAPLGGSAEQRVEQAEAKYDALEALKDWTGDEVGLGSDEYIAVDEERMAMDDRVAQLEDEASSEGQAQPVGARQEEPARGEEPAADPASETDEEGSGGFNVFPALLLLLGGGAYYAVRRSRSGNKGRVPSTPLASRAAARASGAKVGPQSSPPAAPSDPGSPPPPPPSQDAAPGPFDGVPPRSKGPESEEPPQGGRRRQDVPPPEDDEDLGGCPSCGAEVGPRALFCRGCGHRIGGA